MLDLTPEQRMLVADERGYASKRHCQPQDSAFVFYSLDWLIMSGLALFVSETGSKGGAILDLW